MTFWSLQWQAECSVFSISMGLLSLRALEPLDLCSHRKISKPGRDTIILWNTSIFRCMVLSFGVVVALADLGSRISSQARTDNVSGWWYCLTITPSPQSRRHRRWRNMRPYWVFLYDEAAGLSRPRYQQQIHRSFYSVCLLQSLQYSVSSIWNMQAW